MNGRLLALAMLALLCAPPAAWGDPPDSGSDLDRIRGKLDATPRDTPYTDAARRLIDQLPVQAPRMRRPDVSSTSFPAGNQHWVTRRHLDMSGAGIDSVAAAGYSPEIRPRRPGVRSEAPQHREPGRAVAGMIGRSRAPRRPRNLCAGPTDITLLRRLLTTNLDVAPSSTSDATLCGKIYP